MSTLRTYDALHRRLARLAPCCWEGTAYRMVDPAWGKTVDITTGAGAAQYGARWNPAGVAAVYGTLTPRATVAEMAGNARALGLRLEDWLPRLLVALRIRVARALDLTDGRARIRLQVSRERMIRSQWRASRETLTQRIGRAAGALGIELLLVPSAVDPNATNVVVFPACLAGRSYVKTQGL